MQVKCLHLVQTAPTLIALGLAALSVGNKQTETDSRVNEGQL